MIRNKMLTKTIRILKNKLIVLIPDLILLLSSHCSVSSETISLSHESLLHTRNYCNFSWHKLQYNDKLSLILLSTDATVKYINISIIASYVAIIHVLSMTALPYLIQVCDNHPQTSQCNHQSKHSEAQGWQLVSGQQRSR